MAFVLHTNDLQINGATRILLLFARLAKGRGAWWANRAIAKRRPSDILNKTSRASGSGTGNGPRPTRITLRFSASSSSPREPQPRSCKLHSQGVGPGSNRRARGIGGFGRGLATNCPLQRDLDCLSHCLGTHEAGAAPLRAHRTSLHDALVNGDGRQRVWQVLAGARWPCPTLARRGLGGAQRKAAGRGNLACDRDPPGLQPTPGSRRRCVRCGQAAGRERG
jgi:hypothetical protein